jgi:uncharacterized membrane protein
MLKKMAPFVMAPLVPALVLVMTFFGLGYIGIGGGFTGAIWMFVVFGVIFSLAGLLLAWTFVGWNETNEPEPSFRRRRSPFRRL